MRFLALFGIFFLGSLSGNWSPPVDLFTAHYAQYPAVGVDGAGNAVVIAVVSDDGTLSYTKAAQLVNGTAQNIQNFIPIGILQTTNAISVNATGNAVASWLENDLNTSDSFVRSSVLIENSWSPPETVSDPSDFSVQSTLNPGVYLNASDQALSIWSGFNRATSTFNLQENLFSSEWGTIQDIYTSPQFLTGAVLAGSPSGQAIAVWCANHPSILKVAYFDGDHWAATTLSADVSQSPVPITAVAMNTSHDAIILWDRKNHGLRATSFSNGSYKHPQSIYTPSGNEVIDSAAIAIDASGNAIALWITSNWDNASEYRVMTNRFSNHVWGSPEILDTATNSNFSHPNISMDDTGNAYAVWEKDGEIYYNRYSALNHSWLSTRLLSTSGVSATQPRLAMNGAGAAVVAFSAGDFENQTIQAVYKPNPLSPPQHFSCHQIDNQFLFWHDLINVLNWTASPDPSIVQYHLFRNGEPLATIPASGTLSFQDHQRQSGVRDVYLLIAVDEKGNESFPLSFTL